MAEFGVNLIRTRVPPLSRRRTLFRNLVLYLAVCGLLLAAVLYAGVRDTLAAVRNRSSLESLETAFRSVHPEHRDILAYAADVEQRGTALAGVLEEVQKSVSGRADVAHMVAAITAALPEGIRLVEFSLDSAKGEAWFDLAAPVVTRTGEPTDPSGLVGIWNRDASLGTSLRHIQSVESHRRIVDGVPTFVLRFAGTLPGSEGS